MNKLQRIYSGIKEVKIQGATNIAKAALSAYLVKPDEDNKKKLIGLRPTEPMLTNAISMIGKMPEKEIIRHFKKAQDKINRNLFRLIKNKSRIFTHCHSTNVINALIYAKKKGKRFEVFNTETRPLYQGRITARELSKRGIKVSDFVDSAMHEAIKKADMVLIGSDAILENGVINKIGSASAAEIAFIHKKPFYVVSDSWKFSPKHIKIEERDFHEVWEYAPKKIKVMNPAFEKVDRKYVKGIVSEYGLLSYSSFLKKAERENLKERV